MYEDQNGYSGTGYQHSGDYYSQGSSYTNATGTNQGSSAGGYSSYHISGNGPEEKKPKKKGTGKKVAKVLALILVLVLAGGVGFYAGGLSDEKSGEDKQVGAVDLPEDKDEAEEPEKDDLIPAVNATGGTTNTIVSDVSEVVEAVIPSVVSITNAGVEELQTFFGTQQIPTSSSGSGIIIGQNDEELLIVTNNHVVADSQELSVSFVDDSVAEAYVKGVDEGVDLAVVAVKLDQIEQSTKDQIKTAALGDSNALKVGEPAIAIGNALGYGQSVTTGVISALDREVEGYNNKLIQTDAAINPGNSGGALLNVKGEVIGINVMKLASDKIEGMGYAIPISNVSEIIDTLMTRDTRNKVPENERGYLGITGVDVTEDVESNLVMPQGVYVVQVTSGGVAEAAGIYKGDIITKFDGISVNSMNNLKSMLEYYKAGETVEIAVQSLNQGEYVERTVSLTLGGRPTE